MRKILFALAIALPLMMQLTSCTSSLADEPESGLYNWEITYSIYYSHGSDVQLDKRWNETLYNKSLEYVKSEKEKFESNSTSYYKYKYAYQRLN